MPASMRDVRRPIAAATNIRGYGFRAQPLARLPRNDERERGNAVRRNADFWRALNDNAHFKGFREKYITSENQQIMRITFVFRSG